MHFKRIATVITLSLVLAFGAFGQGIGGLGPGLGGDINPFLPEYQKALLVKTLTAQAETANAKAAAAYLTQANDWVTNALADRSAGRPVQPAPEPPLAIHIDQKTGAQTSGPDAVAQKPVLPAEQKAGDSGSNGLIANPNAPPDRLDQVLSGLAILFDKITKLQADVAALKSKFGAAPASPDGTMYVQYLDANTVVGVYGDNSAEAYVH